MNCVNEQIKPGVMLSTLTVVFIVP